MKPQVAVAFGDSLLEGDMGTVNLAVFDRERRTIRVMRPERQVRLWKLVWDTRLLSAVLIHEAVHATVDQISSSLPSLMAEFVASEVQFESTCSRTMSHSRPFDRWKQLSWALNMPWTQRSSVFAPIYTDKSMVGPS